MIDKSSLGSWIPSNRVRRSWDEFEICQPRTSVPTQTGSSQMGWLLTHSEPFYALFCLPGRLFSSLHLTNFFCFLLRCHFSREASPDFPKTSQVAPICAPLALSTLFNINTWWLPISWSFLVLDSFNTRTDLPLFWLWYSSMQEAFSPGWCGSVDWVPACEPKGRWFNSQSGHKPGLWARFPVGGV